MECVHFGVDGSTLFLSSTGDRSCRNIMPSCSAFACSNQTESGKALFCTPCGNDDRDQRSAWLHRIGRKNFTHLKNTRLIELRTKTRKPTWQRRHARFRRATTNARPKHQ